METAAAAAGAEDGAASSVEDEVEGAEVVERLWEQPLVAPLLPAIIITIDSVVVMAYSVVVDRLDAVDAPPATVAEGEETTGAADDDRRQRRRRRRRRRMQSALIILT
jgi:hypothetical protein